MRHARQIAPVLIVALALALSAFAQQRAQRHEPR